MRTTTATRTFRSRAKSRFGWVLATQIALVAVVLAAWEFVPWIPGLAQRSPIFDRFFISSPSRIADQLWSLVSSTGPESVWPYLWPTIGSSVVGLVVGTVLGIAFGLVLGSLPFVSSVMRPFLVAFNAVPRIALIPVVVIVFGTSFQSQVVISVLIVFFVVFFNAYEGAQSVPEPMLQNATLMAATPLQLTRKVRFPYVMVWTLAALPVAATFSVISVVTGEILTGYQGLGRMITTAQSTADSTLTFAVVVILAAFGLAVVGVSELIKRRSLHWWVGGRS